MERLKNLILVLFIIIAFLFIGFFSYFLFPLALIVLICFSIYRKLGKKNRRNNEFKVESYDLNESIYEGSEILDVDFFEDINKGDDDICG